MLQESSRPPTRRTSMPRCSRLCGRTSGGQADIPGRQAEGGQAILWALGAGDPDESRSARAGLDYELRSINRRCVGEGLRQHGRADDHHADAPDLVAQSIASERWPVEVKLHGDFRSRRLKNTTDELRRQDAILRRALLEASKRFGLVVAGYSGRDISIMETLTVAVNTRGALPGGLFWLHRGDGEPMTAVADLLALARERGIDGGRPDR